MAWHSSVDLARLGEDTGAIRFYEAIIEAEPDEIPHYWYLGLAYLLAGREEEARATWLFILGQLEETEIEARTAELVAILEEEAERLTEFKQWETSALIRDYISELYPDSLENRLKLIGLEIQLDRFSPEILGDRSLLELVGTEVAREIPDRIWLAFFERVLDYPCTELVEIWKRAIERLPLEKLQVLLERKIDAISAKDIPFAIAILKPFLAIKPDSLPLLDRLALDSLAIEDYRTAIDCRLKMREFYGSLPLATKAFLDARILYTQMYSADWLNIEDSVHHYKKSLQETLDAGECPRMGEHATATVNFPLVYLEDNPVETRSFFNRTGELFQAWMRENLPRNRKAMIARPTVPEKLRIGYIAYTLNAHTIGVIARWPVHYHDREKFFLGIYLVNQKEDEITRDCFRSRADICHNFPDDAVAIADRIEADGIDILVDLDSITGQTTCQVMALKPAPVQVTWLGFDASGIPAVDYLLADRYVLPENAEQYYSEKIWRLPDCYIAVDGIEVAVPSLRREDLNIPTDSIVYLTVQSGFKRAPEHIHRQLAVVREVPNSYLLVQGAGDSRSTRELFSDIALKEGVNPDRLRFLPRYPAGVYRANLQVADVVLDTYPFSGGMTTLDVLWMGIPIVTRVGQQWASRNTYTLMANAGITEGIARNDGEYLEWGIRFGTDATLRNRVAAKIAASRRTAPIWNARQFTRNLEDAYRQMWRNYTENRGDL